MDTESLNSELDKFVLVYFYFHFIFVLFQKKRKMLRYLHILFDCVRVLYFRTFTYLVVKFSFSSNIRPDET